ncbi:UTRA domain-containing protein [Streptomyces sp. SID13666]|uniref:GntR family transcriptional regulator n=1 Tax=Streptomyces TaxID=1883 RepID=UPI0013BFCBE3|nr:MULTISPECIES: UTRA domain-containing protein [Streptomyces]MCZ4103116.1 UTRA domain-containing protein [Streptomyces sp. H39-C1]NEA58864.1 UTRA domain-containing protein [Streptomyces sp. SID13666]NEA72924.1 UTRA domain-containing protein [Streptomyces sp. SID13588]
MTNEEWESESTRYLTPRGQGRSDAWTEEAAENNRRGGQRLLAAGMVVPPLEVARALRLPEGEQVVVRRRLILLDGLPVELADSYYPARIAAGTELAEQRKVPGGAVTLLARLGHVAGHVEESVTARMPTEVEREALQLGEQDPVILLSRLILSGDDQPMEACVMTMTASDRVLRYRLRLG